MSSATAAPPASAIPARSSPRSPPASRRETSSATSVLSGNRNFEGRVHPEVKMNFLASPPLVVAYALAGTMDIDLQKDSLGDGAGWQAGAARQHLAIGQGSSRRGAEDAGLEHVPQELRERVHRRQQLVFHQGARGQDLRVGGQVHLRAQSALLRWHDHDAAARDRRHRRALPGPAGRLGHHRPHLARRRHRQDQPGREVPGVAGRAAGGLQFLRCAPRQPRSHDARHVRQHPAAQPAGAGHRRRRDRPRAHRRADDHLRRRHALQDRKARRW